MSWTGGRQHWPGWGDAMPSPLDGRYDDGVPGRRPHVYSIATHRRGVAWNEHRPPLPWLHWRCRPQTTQRVDGILVQRCRCGAIREDHGPWSQVNSRRHT
jgi:hypothetical protein